MTGTTKFRLNAAEQLALNVPNSQVLQSQILYHINFEARKNISTSRCTFCHCVLANSCHFKIIPKKLMHKKTKELVKKANLEDALLSKFQKSLLKKLNRPCGNTVVFTCSVCKRKNSKQLLKPISSNPIVISDEANESVVVIDKKKKKKKKKDKLAGLKISSVSNPAQTSRISGKKVKQNVEGDSCVSSSSAIISKGAGVDKKNTKVSKEKIGDNLNKNNVAKLKMNKLNNSKVKAIPAVASNLNASAVVKKFKKGNKLAQMLQAADSAKLVQKKSGKKSSLLPALQLLLRK